MLVLFDRLIIRKAKSPVWHFELILNIWSPVAKIVVVNYGNSYEFSAKLVKDGINYQIMQKLGQYSVNIHEKVFKELFRLGIIKEVLQGVYFLPVKEQYDEKTGLMIESHWLEEILI